MQIIYNGLKSNVDHSASDFESIAYSQMISSFVTAEADERRVTIELQIEKSVKFASNILAGVVMPTQLRDAPPFSDLISSTDLISQSYDIDVWNPAYSFGFLTAVAKEIASRMRKS